MTREEREEAIRCLSIHSSTNGSGLCTDKQHYEAKQMAIKVLKQEPCDDAISRKSILKYIDDWWSDSRDDIEDLIIYITYLPSVTQKSGKRIPVSERLPEDSNYYLCCGKDGYMIIGWISKWSKEWCFDDDEIDMDVVAWMPLPQPYKAESEEE